MKERSTNSMVHEEQGVVRSPFRSHVASGGNSAVGTVTSHVTTGVRQLQTQG